MKRHEKHDEIYSMFKKGRPFKNIDEELGLKENEARSYLVSVGLFEIMKVNGTVKKLKKGEMW